MNIVEPLQVLLKSGWLSGIHAEDRHRGRRGMMCTVRNTYFQKYCAFLPSLLSSAESGEAILRYRRL